MMTYEQQIIDATAAHLGRDLSEADRISIIATAEQATHAPCEYCDGTGDVHGLDGEWRGACGCAAGRDLHGEGK